MSEEGINLPQNPDDLTKKTSGKIAGTRGEGFIELEKDDPFIKKMKGFDSQLTSTIEGFDHSDRTNLRYEQEALERYLRDKKLYEDLLEKAKTENNKYLIEQLPRNIKVVTKLIKSCQEMIDLLEANIARREQVSAGGK